MSPAQRFAAAHFPTARAVLGGEDITVGGGPAVSAVQAESDQSREYDGKGYDRDQSLSVVVSRPEWVASYPLADKEYLGKAAIARGITWRVGGCTSGAAFVTLSLISPRKGA